MTHKIIHLGIQSGKELLSDILIAELGQLGYDGFEELDRSLKAYVPSDQFDESKVTELIDRYKSIGEVHLTSIEDLENKNWNEVWESNFDPVLIGEDIAIRAPFHPEFADRKYLINIEPKMAFGTGHHATTSMMMTQMLQIEEWKNKRVLDFGCGTGVLAILAHQLGATDIHAVDYDIWSYENTIENCKVNSRQDIKVYHGEIDAVSHQTYDIILANINRNVILSTLEKAVDLLQPSGYIMYSGVLIEDLPLLEEAASKSNLQAIKTLNKAEWAMQLYKKAND